MINAEPSAKPPVTFALFAYNQERYIREAIEGAFAQTYEPLEIILSDDCSSDGTFAIMQEMAAGYRGPHTIRLNRNIKNLGLAGHINTIFSSISNDIVVIAAGDDISAPQRTEWSVKLLGANTGASAVSFASTPIDANGCELGSVRHRTKSGKLVEHTLADLLSGRIATSGASRAVRKSVFDQFGPLGPECPTEDTPFLLRSLCLGSVLQSNETMIRYRIHESNLSGRQNLAQMQAESHHIVAQYRRDIVHAAGQGIISSLQEHTIGLWIEKSAGARQMRYELSTLPPSWPLAIRAFRSGAFSNRELAGYLKLVLKGALKRPAGGPQRATVGIVGESASSNVGDQLIYSVLQGMVRTKAEPFAIPLTRGEPWLRRLGQKSSSPLVRRLLGRLARMGTDHWYRKREGRRLASLIARCDAVIIGGGELVRQNDVGFIDNLGHVTRICRETGKRYAFFGIGISGNLSLESETMAASFLRDASGIWTRDEQSRQRSDRLLANAPSAKTVPDVVFHSSARSGGGRVARRSQVAINVMSHAAFAAGLKRRGIIVERERYMEFFLEVAETFSSQGMEVSVFTTGSGGDLADARYVAHCLAGRSGFAPGIADVSSADELFRIAESCEFVLATRMHAGIASFMAGARTLALDWDDKVAPCWAMVGRSEAILPADFPLLPQSGSAAAHRLLTVAPRSDADNVDRFIGEALDNCLVSLTG